MGCFITLSCNKSLSFSFRLSIPCLFILSKTDIKKTKNLQYTNKHVPVSFSIFSNIEGYNIKPIHVVNKDPKELIKILKINIPRAKLILLAAPAAEAYYPKIGMQNHPHCYFINEVEEIN